jgi:hypothetical protein
MHTKFRLVPAATFGRPILSSMSLAAAGTVTVAELCPAAADPPVPLDVLPDTLEGPALLLPVNVLAALVTLPDGVEGAAPLPAAGVLVLSDTLFDEVEGAAPLSAAALCGDTAAALGG